MQSKKMTIYRILIVGILIVLQAWWLVSSVLTLSSTSTVVSMILKVLSIVVIFVVINSRQNPSYKLAWVVPILMFPVFGGLMFVIFGTRRPTKRLRRRLNDSWAMLKPHIGENEEVLKKLKKENASVYGQALYLKKFADAPMWQNTQTTYFKSGEENFPYIIEELKKAKNFIFRQPPGWMCACSMMM